MGGISTSYEYTTHTRPVSANVKATMAFIYSETPLSNGKTSIKITHIYFKNEQDVAYGSGGVTCLGEAYINDSLAVDWGVGGSSTSVSLPYNEWAELPGYSSTAVEVTGSSFKLTFEGGYNNHFGPRWIYSYDVGPAYYHLGIPNDETELTCSITPSTPTYIAPTTLGEGIKTNLFIKKNKVEQLLNSINTLYANRGLSINGQNLSSKTLSNINLNEKINIDNLGKILNNVIIVNSIDNIKYSEKNQPILYNGTTINDVLTWVDSYKNKKMENTGSGCRGACLGLCEGGCYGAAKGGIKFNSSCDGNCSTGCYGGCQGACQSTCKDSCTTSCTTTCYTTAQ